MKSKYLLVSFVLGLGLALCLLWTLDDGGVWAKTPNAPAAELHVCVTCTYTTVQAAVDAADVGDVIKVAGGVYTGVQARSGITQMVYISKTVTVRGGYTITDWLVSDPDANPTALDAQGQGRVLYVTGDIIPTVEGLRITGGNAAGLGGSGSGWDAGGGLYVVNAAVTIINSQVFSNTAFGGGGMYLHRSAATLTANTISGNTTNGAQDGGGGLYLSESPATLSGNTISANDTTNEGGGLYVLSSDATFEANLITLNSAGDDGGGLYLNDSDVTLDNNVIADNQAANFGGGVYVRGTSLRMRHNTLARNAGDSGIHVTEFDSHYSTAALTNTILVSHTVGIAVTAGNAATLEATLWGAGAWANVADWGGAGVILTGTVNVRGDPAFVGDGDYHITDGSEAKDQGVDAGLAPDMDWDLRPIGAGFDIGADELPVVVTASQEISITLVYTDPKGSVTKLRVPVGAVTDTIMLVYTPKDPQTAYPLPEGMVLGAHVFDLDVYRNDVLMPHFAFAKVVTLTSEYTDTDVVGMVEDTLALYRKVDSEWQEIGARVGETQTLNADNNMLTAYLLGTSRFREAGEGITLRFLFLPLVIRSG